MTPDRDDQLEWLAFRYAAGEMSDEEERQFELRLTDDQLAREAVEQAVELSEAVRLAAAETPSVRPARPTRWMRRLSVFTATGAALLLAVYGATWLLNAGNRPPVNVPTDVSQQDASLALEWAALRERQETEVDQDLPDQDLPAQDLPETSDAPWGDDSGELPQWLLTAVSVETKSMKETP